MLNKKALRKFADDNHAPAIPPSHGLLHAPQVKYIARTSVKIIGHRRTLVLYVYDRKRAVDGDHTPVWTMFQAGGDYITLARWDDGSTSWREAAFERLGKDYCFTSKCAFYSVKDEQRVCGFLHDNDHGGIAALVRAQTAILNKRCQERQRKREQRTVQRMRPSMLFPAVWMDGYAVPSCLRISAVNTHRSSSL